MRRRLLRTIAEIFYFFAGQLHDLALWLFWQGDKVDPRYGD